MIVLLLIDACGVYSIINLSRSDGEYGTLSFLVGCFSPGGAKKLYHKKEEVPRCRRLKLLIE
jgi:hypothetical protein